MRAEERCEEGTTKRGEKCRWDSNYMEDKEIGR
jgi:hypothetical protein